MEMCVFVLLATVVLCASSPYDGIPELQQDQPADVGPGPSSLDLMQNDYRDRVSEYRARALKLLSSRAKSMESSVCSEQYRELSENHTMCLPDVGFPVRLSETRREAIVRHHNRYRSRVSPTATNMQKMVWDDSLAKVAAKWARQCRRGHDKKEDRQSPDLPGTYIGQNAAYGFRSFQAAIEAWHDEVADFKFGEGPIEEDRIVGHYTQLVAWRSARVGCGQADCPKSKYRRHYVCNYAIGQINDDPKTPYNKGDSCAECPEHCDEDGNLCDCGGLLCLNGGKIDLTKCQCKCPTIYKGDVCQTLQCPEEDPWYCGSQWPENYCEEYENVPLECPYMCGTCSDEDKKNTSFVEAARECRLQCKNGGKVDSKSCKCICPEGFTGKRCERKATKLCGGKTCLNGGQLNTDTCQCVCPLLLTGDRCETKVQICGGKTCKNRGRLDTAMCECRCREGYTGTSCETSIPVCENLTCKNGGRLDESSCTCLCPKQFTGKRCHQRKCVGVQCSNGSVVNYDDCTCQCKDGFTGERCEQEEEEFAEISLCPKECQNGGLLDPVTCRCWCPSPFVGELCEEVECPDKDKEACTNLPAAYCPEHFLMRHLCPYKCQLCEEKECPDDKWFCSASYIKPHLCRVVGNYCPNFCGLC